MANRDRKTDISITYGDKIFDIVNIILMIIMFFIFTWPLWFVFIASISDPKEVSLGHVLLLPKKITLISYKEMLKYSSIWTGYINTIYYTVVGTFVNVVLTICAAYPLSRKDFVPRNFLMGMFVVTMYFGGGLIPTYLVVKSLGLINTRWAMIIPSAISIYNVIITRTYFINNIPKSIEEAAIIDGANTARFLLQFVIPLSKPVLAVITLYYAVAHWNDYYTALIYLSKKELFPLQLFLRDILMSANITTSETAGMDPLVIEARMNLAQTLKYSTIIVSSVPVLCIYPFIQRYFVKGVMIGSLKG